MKILVTGASGFVGRNLLLALPREWEVVASYNGDKTFPDFINQHSLTHVTPLRIDLRDESAVNIVDTRFKSYDACVYLAANGDPAYSVEAPVDDLRANALGVLNVVNKWTFGKFVYFSSGAVYDGLRGEVNPKNFIEPTLPYAISKWAAERYVMHAQKEGKIKTAIAVRFFGAYGPYEPARKIYGRLVKQFAIEKKSEFTIRGNGQNLIDAMYIDDLTRAIQLLLDKATQSQTLDLYSGSGITVESLVRQTAAVFGLDAQIEFIGNVPEFIEFRSNDQTMLEEFCFRPQIALKDGLLKFHAWMKEENVATV